MSAERGRIYASFIDEQVRQEQQRRVSLDERGTKLQHSISVTAGLFVAALGALGRKSVFYGGVAELLLFTFTVAAVLATFVCGVLATRIIPYAVADSHTLAKMVNERWGDAESASLKAVSYANLKTVKSLRHGNNYKAGWLHRGIVCQGVAVVFGAATFAFVAARTAWEA